MSWGKRGTPYSVLLAFKNFYAHRRGQTQLPVILSFSPFKHPPQKKRCLHHPIEEGNIDIVGPPRKHGPHFAPLNPFKTPKAKFPKPACALADPRPLSEAGALSAYIARRFSSACTAEERGGRRNDAPQTQSFLSCQR